MRTGWTITGPTSLRDYDDNLRTVTIQTRLTNLARNQ